MVGGGVRIEAQVGPVAKVAVAPDGDIVCCASSGRCACWAGEGFEVEEVDLIDGEGAVGGENGNGVISKFIVVISSEVWKRCECACQCEGRVIGEDGHVIHSRLKRRGR